MLSHLHSDSLRQFGFRLWLPPRDTYGALNHTDRGIRILHLIPAMAIFKVRVFPLKFSLCSLRWLFPGDCTTLWKLDLFSKQVSPERAQGDPFSRLCNSARLQVVKGKGNLLWYPCRSSSECGNYTFSVYIVITFVPKSVWFLLHLPNCLICSWMNCALG